MASTTEAPELTLDELKSSAQAYRSKKADEQKRANQEEQREAQRVREDSQEQAIKRQVQADQIFERLRARQVLTLVKDQLWHEGTIDPRDGVPTSTGLLRSRDYWDVNSSNITDGLVVSRTRQNVNYRITVKFNDQNQPYVEVVDDHLYQLDPLPEPDELMSLLSESTNLGKFLNDLVRGRRHIIQAYPNRINPEEQDAFGQLSAAVVRQDELRSKNNSYPAQLRGWNTKLIGLLPESLVHGGYVPPHELRSWAHDLRGSSKLRRWLDRRGLFRPF